MQSAGRIEWRRPLLAHCLGCKRSCELMALGSTEPWLGKANIFANNKSYIRMWSTRAGNPPCSSRKC
eukprot:COSAG05_NODE_1055_length_6012_cov_4.772028_8_plen_67_part_00